MMDAAKIIIDDKIAQGEWEPRKLGWFKVDIDKHPELNINEHGRPD